MVDPELLDILVCPATKAPLIYRADEDELWSIEAKLAYPVRDGIPVMVEAEARPLSDDDVASASG